MQIEDHALIYRIEPHQWRAARWHFGLSRWLPVLHIEGAARAAACQVIRAEPGCNHTIVAAPLDLDRETLDSVDRFTTLPSVTITCPDDSMTGPVATWRSLHMVDGRLMRPQDSPETLFRLPFLAERIDGLKRPSPDVESEERSREVFGRLLRWDWDASLLIAEHARAA